MSEEICYVCCGSGETGLGFWQACQRCFGTGVVEDLESGEIEEYNAIIEQCKEVESR